MANFTPSSGGLGAFYTGNMAPPMRMPDGSLAPAPTTSPSYNINDFYRGILPATTPQVPPALPAQPVINQVHSIAINPDGTPVGYGASSAPSMQQTMLEQHQTPTAAPPALSAINNNFGIPGASGTVIDNKSQDRLNSPALAFGGGGTLGGGVASPPYPGDLSSGGSPSTGGGTQYVSPDGSIRVPDQAGTSQMPPGYRPNVPSIPAPPTVQAPQQMRVIPNPAYAAAMAQMMAANNTRDIHAKVNVQASKPLPPRYISVPGGSANLPSVPPPIQTVQIASGRTVPVGTTGTAQGGQYTYHVLSNGSIMRSDGVITATANGPVGVAAVANSNQYKDASVPTPGGKFGE